MQQYLRRRAETTTEESIWVRSRGQQSQQQGTSHLATEPSRQGNCYWSRVRVAKANNSCMLITEKSSARGKSQWNTVPPRHATAGAQ